MGLVLIASGGKLTRGVTGGVVSSWPEGALEELTSEKNEAIFTKIGTPAKNKPPIRKIIRIKYKNIFLVVRASSLFSNLDWYLFIGAVFRDRTEDLRFTKASLYQLS